MKPTRRQRQLRRSRDRRNRLEKEGAGQSRVEEEIIEEELAVSE